VAQLVAADWSSLGFDGRARRTRAGSYVYRRLRSDGSAVIVCPAAATHIYRRERRHARRELLNGLGIRRSCFAYRLADFGHPAPLEDVLAAMQTSAGAGGHLEHHAEPYRCARLFSGRTLGGRRLVPVRRRHARSDFAILATRSSLKPRSPTQASRRALLGADPTPRSSSLVARNPGHGSTRTFLMHTRDDASVPSKTHSCTKQPCDKAGRPERAPSTTTAPRPRPEPETKPAASGPARRRVAKVARPGLKTSSPPKHEVRKPSRARSDKPRSSGSGHYWPIFSVNLSRLFQH